MKRRVLWLASALALAVATLIAAPVLRAGSETINYSDINKIKAEGLQRSQVMELCSWLSDVYTPRVTGSPTAMKAAEWAVAKMKAWGLSNVAIEPWGNRNGFDRGWTQRQVLHGGDRARALPGPGHADGVDTRNERTGQRRGRSGHRHHRRGPGAVQGQAQGEMGAGGVGARRGRVLGRESQALQDRRPGRDGTAAGDSRPGVRRDAARAEGGSATGGAGPARPVPGPRLLRPVSAPGRRPRRHRPRRRSLRPAAAGTLASPSFVPKAHSAPLRRLPSATASTPSAATAAPTPRRRCRPSPSPPSSTAASSGRWRRTFR